MKTKSYGVDLVRWYSIEGNYVGLHMLKVVGLSESNSVEATVYRFEQPQVSLDKIEAISGSVPLQTTFWGKCHTP